LISAFKIDDFQTRSPEGKQIRGENALLVRTPVEERCHHIPNLFSGRRRILMCESRYPAQYEAPF
jgi:hypothetical protein